MPIRLIALCGYKGSGKSVVASHLDTKYGYRKFKFADPLKNMLRALGLTHAELEGPLKELPCAALLGLTPRHAMQTLGTEWGRQLINQEIWTYTLQRQVNKHLGLSKDNAAVISDLRFVNEARAVRGMGGEVWFIDRPGHEAGGHASEQEQALINEDILLINDKDPAWLLEMVDGLMERGNAP